MCLSPGIILTADRQLHVVVVSLPPLVMSRNLKLFQDHHGQGVSLPGIRVNIYSLIIQSERRKWSNCYSSIQNAYKELSFMPLRTKLQASRNLYDRHWWHWRDQWVTCKKIVGQMIRYHDAINQALFNHPFQPAYWSTSFCKNARTSHLCHVFPNIDWSQFCGLILPALQYTRTCELSLWSNPADYFLCPSFLSSFCPQTSTRFLTSKHFFS